VGCATGGRLGGDGRPVGSPSRGTPTGSDGRAVGTAVGSGGRLVGNDGITEGREIGSDGATGGSCGNVG